MSEGGQTLAEKGPGRLAGITEPQPRGHGFGLIYTVVLLLLGPALHPTQHGHRCVPEPRAAGASAHPSTPKEGGAGTPRTVSGRLAPRVPSNPRTSQALKGLAIKWDSES